MSVVLPLFAEGSEIVRLGGVDVTFVPLVRVWTRALPSFYRTRAPRAFPRHEKSTKKNPILNQLFRNLQMICKILKLVWIRDSY